MKYVVKDGGYKHFNDTLDSQLVSREFSGKRRLHYEAFYSSGSPNSTPHLYEPEAEGKQASYSSEPDSPVNVYDEYRRQEEAEEDQEEGTENNPGVRTARSERGLKRLSVKVRDLVYKIKETSYKDVANKLIEELVVDDEYDEYDRKVDKRTNNDRKTKEEKNVRRRVYDALNVLIASGVLRKNANKNVTYEDKPETRMRGLKLVVKKKHENKKKHLAKAIYTKKAQLTGKRQKLKEHLDKLIALKTLIKRNKTQEAQHTMRDQLMSHEIHEKIHEDKEYYNASSNQMKSEIVEKIHFPMVVLGTQNTKQNQVNI